MSKTNYWDQIEQAFEDVDIYETYEVFKQGASRYPEWKIDLLAVHSAGHVSHLFYRKRLSGEAANADDCQNKLF